MNPSMFMFDPAQYRAHFATHGYVHIRTGLTSEFFGTLSEQVDGYLRASTMRVLDKQQAIYKFPAGGDYLNELCATVGGITGIDPSSLVLSERHIKAYSDDAEAYPPPHKDRYASQISLGIAVQVPERSRLILYPRTLTETNPFNAAVRLRPKAENTDLFLSSPAALRGSGSAPHEGPQKNGKTPDGPSNVPNTNGEGAVEIADSAKDVVIFRGHNTWHRRIHSAGTRMLYLKLNGFNCDPLGEDPRTPDIRRNTFELLSAEDATLLKLIPVVGRRVDYFHLYFTRRWEEVASAMFWGEKHFRLSDEELSLVKAIDSASPLMTVCTIAGVEPTGRLLQKVRQLAEHGVIDFIVPEVRKSPQAVHYHE